MIAGYVAECLQVIPNEKQPMRILLILILLASVTSAQESKPEKQPKIIVAVPLVVTVGTPVKITLRGLFLDEITEIKLGDTKLEIDSKGKTAVPQNYDAKRVGDTQAEVSIMLPAETAPGMLKLQAASPNGTTQYDIAAVRADDLIVEKEPNDGFKGAQAVTIGKTVVGTIHDPRNVDLFSLEGTAGEKLTIRVQAAQLGSLLDPFLTLYDENGQVVAANDDVDGRDPRLEVELKRTGRYFVLLQDANDSGGPHFCYLLKIDRKS